MNLLYLVHRLPYPPNKGDKVRSYHLLRHLAARHRVFLGSFVDDPDDEAHADTLRQWCADLHLARLHPRSAKIQSLPALLGDEPLTLRYYRDAGLAQWVRAVAARERLDAVVVFSSSMAQYAEGLGLPVLVDFVDVDSAKWTQYAEHHRWPLSWVYRREGERLLAVERAVASRAARAFFVTDAEAALFRRLAPECAARVVTSGNGVDADHFAPDPARGLPFAAGEVPVVFTGAMDYWPNVDAVTWFAREALPALRERWPALRFHIVGRSPAPAVQALAGDAVHVTGTVPDVRPYLQHAAVVVAPLRVARGIQNKVLEAMAMARPVVAAAGCAQPIGARLGDELIAAADAPGFVREVDALLRDPARAAAVGAAGRRRVVDHHSWPAQLAPIDVALDALRTAQPLAA
ncbi:TIGR03087 family PEP-CTERM/XrtA system glycosyltransferase [Azohydromonas sediminis]|uniref:TIGR03087 family PEP-CTERM/XrtA system glycosyltransferase n=1 Tax=Azohydromonas sediminis TaxID=2259674 RepID=UPI000E65E348|nr:TIGR03087 family PEP-CTERM/XrtA system glycosyltransferase [Azohydromonas sediminis]